MSNMSEPKAHSYRADIDGLRAIAVGVVVLYHAKLGLFPGGYAGVDVFFVISGFLISSIILNESQSGSFTMAGFYERRIRRIFPALAVVMIFTLAVGALLFAPQDYFLLGRSARATAAFYSNFYFNDQFGYFMPGAETQPLLHTWSLAVEEQFYLIAPFFLILLLRLQSFWRMVTFLAIFALSLAISTIGALEESKSAFYLPHSRAWELMVGMALAIGLNPSWKQDIIRELAALTGLGMIIATALLYSELTPFPGIAACLPCIGTALLISTGASRSTFVSRALSAPLFVYLGKISYSLYLWHWPLFVFAEYQYGEQLPLSARIALIGLSVACAALSFRFVEQPARQRSPRVSRNAAIGTGIAVMLLLAGYSQLLIESRGLPQRLPSSVAELARLAEQSKVLPPCPDPEEPSASAAGCEIGQKNAGAAEFLLWGDSHAISLSGQFSMTAEAIGKKGIAAVVGGCPPILISASKSPLYFKKDKCRDVSRRAGFMLSNKGAPHVIIAARWVYYTEGALDDPDNSTNRFSSGNAVKDREVFYASLRDTIDTIVKSGRTVTLIGPVPELPFHLPNAMMKAMMRGQPIEFNRPYKEFADRQRLVFEKLAELDTLAGVNVVYPHKLLCNTSTCKTTISGKPLYYDDDHLGSYGAAIVEPAIMEALAKTPSDRPTP